MLFRRLFGPVFLGALAVLGYYLLNINNLNADIVEVNDFYGEQFFAVLSTLYAIMTALVLIKGLDSVDSLTAALLREATKIRTVASLSSAFQGEAAASSIRHLRTELGFYVDSLLEQRHAQTLERNAAAMETCRRIVAATPTDNAFDAELKIELIREIEALRLLRAERGSLAMQKLPGYLIWMLAVMTLAIIAPFFVEHTLELGFNYYAIFTLSTFGSFIFFMMQDINRPYDGLWTVDFSPFEDAHAALSEGRSGD